MKNIYLEADNIANISGVSHGFFTRNGGVSGGVYGSLNGGLGSKDKQSDIAKNRDIIRSEIGATALCSLAQIHSAKVVTVTEPWLSDALPEADAMVTSQTDLALGILTADCVPVLFADNVAGVIGAAHAGWQGALGGVVNNTVEAMQAIGANTANIVVAIGPAIGQESYQIDAAFRAKFIIGDKLSEGFFAPDASSDNHYRFDLKGYVYLKCEHAGLSNIEILSEDTYLEEKLFYSYRRTCHRAESDYGRQVSAIMLKG